MPLAQGSYSIKVWGHGKGYQISPYVTVQNESLIAGLSLFAFTWTVALVDGSRSENEAGLSIGALVGK